MADLTPQEAGSTAAPPRKTRYVRQALLLLIGLGLLAMVLSRVTVEGLTDIVSRGQLPQLAAAGLCAAAIYLILPLRLARSLAGKARLKFWPAFVVSLHQGLLLVLLPARAGDIAYPWLLARAASIPVGRAIANLIVIRLCDLTVLCLTAAFGVGALFQVGSYIGFLVAVLVLAVACVAALIFMAELFGAASRMAATLGLARSRIHRWLFEAARGAKLLPRHRLAEVLGWTILRWAVSMVLLWLVFDAFGFALAPIEVVFLAATLYVVALVPIQTFGSFGVAEGALAVGLAGLGFAPEAAAATALVVRTTWFLLVVGVGLLLMAGTRLGPKTIHAKNRSENRIQA